MVALDSSQNPSQGKTKVTIVTAGKCRCMSKTADSVEEKLFKFLEPSPKASPKYDAEDISCLSLAVTLTIKSEYIKQLM